MTTAELPDRDAWFERLRRARFGDTVSCVHCGAEDVIRKGHTDKGARRYFCKACETFFNDLTGTVYAHRHLPPEELWYAIREMESTPVARIARDLDRSYEPLLAFVHAVRESRRGCETASIVPAPRDGIDHSSAGDREPASTDGRSRHGSTGRSVPEGTGSER